MVSLGSDLQSSDEEKKIVAAKEISDFVFPFELTTDTNNALQIRLETKQGRFKYLTETINTQTPDTTNTGPDQVFAMRAEINDLKDQIRQLQGETARRGLSESGRPELHVISDADYDGAQHDFGDDETQLIKTQDIRAKEIVEAREQIEKNGWSSEDSAERKITKNYYG